MAVTANGWPYVEPADKPLEYPALSQQLATKLDPYTPLLPALTTLTPASGWMDMGGGYGGLFVTKQGRIVVIDAVFKPTSDKAVTAGGSYPLATGAPPAAHSIIFGGIYTAGAAIPLLARFEVDAAGAVLFRPGTAGTIATASNFVAVSVSYRAAS